jgi:hypothetical protein
MIDMKKSGGLLNSGDLKPILAKYPSASADGPW